MSNNAFIICTATATLVSLGCVFMACRDGKNIPGMVMTIVTAMALLVLALMVISGKQQ